MQDALDCVCCSYADALSGMSAEQLQLHPSSDPARWNARQLIEHLILTYRSTAAVLEERLQKGRPTQAQTTPQQQARKEWLFARERFPEGMPAPDIVRPGQVDLPQGSGAVMAAFLRSEIETMDQLITRCREMFGTQPMASHFAFGPLSADEWCRFHSIHSQHHLNQLHKIRANVNAALSFTGRSSSTT